MYYLFWKIRDERPQSHTIIAIKYNNRMRLTKLLHMYVSQPYQCILHGHNSTSSDSRIDKYRYFKTRARHSNYVTNSQHMIEHTPSNSNRSIQILFKFKFRIRNGQQPTTTLAVCIETGIGRLNRLFEWAVYLIVVVNATVSFWTYVERVNDVLLRMFWEYLSFLL